jgi:hypothetical protein
MRTVDNVQVLVPNATVFSEVVANQTYARPASADTNGADGHAESVAAHARELP